MNVLLEYLYCADTNKKSLLNIMQAEYLAHARTFCESKTMYDYEYFSFRLLAVFRGILRLSVLFLHFFWRNVYAQHSATCILYIRYTLLWNEMNINHSKKMNHYTKYARIAHICVAYKLILKSNRIVFRSWDSGSGEEKRKYV